MVFNGSKQYYLSSNRIIGDMSDDKKLYFDENILYPEFNFKVEGDLDPLPTLIDLLNQKEENYMKWEKTKRAHEAMKVNIKSQINQLPFLKGYFYLLDMITFAIYYLVSIESLSAFPDTRKSIKRKFAKEGKFYLKTIPSVFPPLPTTKYFTKEYEIKYVELFNRMDEQVKKEIFDKYYRIINDDLNENLDEALKKKIIDNIEDILIKDFYQKYSNLLSIKNKKDFKYSIQYFDYLCKGISHFFSNFIIEYKGIVRKTIEKLNNLPKLFPDMKNKLNKLNQEVSIYEKIIDIKWAVNDKFENERYSIARSVKEKIIKKNLFNSYNYKISDIEPIAKKINDIELINQIEKYKYILNVYSNIEQLIDVLEKKNFIDIIDPNISYKHKIKIISVGYHEGRSSYRGGCLVNSHKDIELAEKKDLNKYNSIKQALEKKKEEIEIGSESYFLVKTKIKSFLYDKESLLEINLSNNKNLKKIIHNISNNHSNTQLKNVNGLSSDFYKLLINEEEVYDTIKYNDLINSDESKENLLTYLPSISNTKLIKNLLIKQIPSKSKNRIHSKNLSISNNMITPLLSAITIQNEEISEIVINKGLNINDTTEIGLSPLHFASYYNLPKVVQLLLEKNCLCNKNSQKEGETPLHLACRKGNFEIVKILLNNHCGDIIDLKKSDNKTSLHLASITSSLCTQILLKNKAFINEKDINGYDPSKLSLIYGREDIFNMIGTNDKSTLEFYDEIRKYDFIRNDDNKNDDIKKLCKYMRKNYLQNAIKCSEQIINNKNIMEDIKNNLDIKNKIIRNACKGISIKYLYILLNLIDLRKYKSLIFNYIYKYNLLSWIAELEKNGIIFNKNISEENWEILEYLLLNNLEEFIKLMILLEEIPGKYLSKILFIKCINKIEINNFEVLFIKFKPQNISIEAFSKTSETTIDDIIYLMKQKNKFDIDLSTFDLVKMIKFCKPSVVKFILLNKEIISYQYKNINNLAIIAMKENRIDNINVIKPTKGFMENMSILLKCLSEKDEASITYDNNKYKFCLYEFYENKNIFDLIIEKRKFKELKRITNFPAHLINKNILFNNVKSLKDSIGELPLKDIFDSYFNFLIDNYCTKGNPSNIKFYSYFIELIDIIISMQKQLYDDFDRLFEETVDSLFNVIKGKNNYFIWSFFPRTNTNYDFSDLISAKNNENQNIMHILSKNRVFISKKTINQIIEILETLKNKSDIKTFKHLFNDKDNKSMTFLMYLSGLEKNELFLAIYMKYKQYINPFIYNSDTNNNILHYILSNLEENSTKKVFIDKYILLIKDIIHNNPNIIFVKNKKQKTPLSIIFASEHNLTGSINLITKLFSFESLLNDEDDSLCRTFINNNIFIIRYLIEYQHLNINIKIKPRYWEKIKFYPLNFAGINSKIDLFELLIQYGANPFVKNESNLDSINIAMQYGNLSFLEHLFKMKISDICFNKQYLFSLVNNKNAYKIFKNLMVERNIEIDIVNSDNENLLMKSCEKDNYELINLLINYGINPLAKNTDNNTALHICCIHNSIKSINILLQKIYYKSKQLLKKCLFFPNINDDTPIHLASRMGNIEIVEKILVYILILENDPKKIRMKSKGEFLPIHYSIINGEIGVSLFLLKALDIEDQEIEDISKDTFYDKIKQFVALKKIYIEKYDKYIKKYIEKLNNDIIELKNNYKENRELYNLCEINNLNAIYDMNSERKINYEKLLNIIIQENKVNITDECKDKLLKYFNFINKEKMVNKIIEIIKSGSIDYLFNLLDILNKSNWIKYEKLERIVHLFFCNILPYIEEKYLKECFEIIDKIINNDLLKDKSADKFLSWVETIIISVSEDTSDFNSYEIICIIKEFYEIIFVKLIDTETSALEILDYPNSNVKFYYYIKQLILLLKYKNKEFCIIQLKNLKYMPPILLEEEEIKNDEYSIFHYSRLHNNNDLYTTINCILKNKSISPKIIDVALSIFNTLLNNINYYEINGSMYKGQKKLLDILSFLISNFNNREKLLVILKYINYNLVEFINKIYNLNIDDLKDQFKVNDDYFEKLMLKKDETSQNEEEIYNKQINDKINEIENTKIERDSNEKNQLKEILKRLKDSRNELYFYNFKSDGHKITKKFFSEPNIDNLIDLINILIKGFLSKNITIDLDHILIFSNFMLFYINKKNEKLKGLIGQNCRESKSTILAMLALTHSLNNKNIDIITSSDYLSNKYYHKYKDIYYLFGIKSSYINSEIEIDNSVQIVYDTLISFQSIILREKFNLKNKFDCIDFFNYRKKSIILFEEINVMVNSDSLLVDSSYSNNFAENYIWAYKSIYNLLKFNNGFLAFNNINLMKTEEIKKSLKMINNGQYKDRVDSIPDELINKLVANCIKAQCLKNGIDYKKELVNGAYKIFIIDENTGTVEYDLKFSSYLQAFIEIKEGIIPSNLSYNIGNMNKLVYINYYYQNIFCIGGAIDNNEIFNLYNMDYFTHINNYHEPKFHLVYTRDKSTKFESICKYFNEKITNKNCNVLILFLNYFEANDFSSYMQNKGINHDFIFGVMNEDLEKKIIKFEREQSILVSTYDCLRGIYFNLSNYDINKIFIIVAFNTPYKEKIMDCFSKVLNKNNEIDVSGIIINNWVREENLYEYEDIEYEIESHKKIIEIIEYQNVLIRLLNSYKCKNLINSYFKSIPSISSFVIDSVNYFRYKWCEYYNKNEHKNIYSFLKLINLEDLSFYINDFESSIQNESLNLIIIINLLFQLKLLFPQKIVYNEIDINNIEDIDKIIEINSIILLEEFNSKYTFIKKKEIDNLIKYPKTSFDQFTIYDKNGNKIKVSRKKVEESLNDDNLKYIEIMDYSDYEKKNEIILVSDLIKSLKNENNNEFNIKNINKQILELNKKKFKIIKQSDKFIEIPEQGEIIKMKLLSEIKELKDIFIKLNDSKNNKEIFLRKSYLEEIINYKPKVPFINFEVLNHKQEKVYTTKDICKKELSLVTNNNYILCYDKTRNDKEIFIPIEIIENIDHDADELIEIGNQEKIAFKNIRIKKLEELSKLGIQPEEEKMIKIFDLILKVNNGPLNQSFKIEDKDKKFCYFISNQYKNIFQEKIKVTDEKSDFEINDAFGKNKIILSGSIIIREDKLGDYILIINKGDGLEYLVRLDELATNLCNFKSTDDKISLTNSIDNTTLELNPLSIDIIPPFNNFPFKKI